MSRSASVDGPKRGLAAWLRSSPVDPGRARGGCRHEAPVTRPLWRTRPTWVCKGREAGRPVVGRRRTRSCRCTRHSVRNAGRRAPRSLDRYSAQRDRRPRTDTRLPKDRWRTARFVLRVSLSRARRPRGRTRQETGQDDDACRGEYESVATVTCDPMCVIDLDHHRVGGGTAPTAARTSRRSNSGADRPEPDHAPLQGVMTRC